MTNIKFMEPMIALPIRTRKNALQNPKEKSKIDANQKSTKSKKIYYSEWGQKIYSGRGSNAEGNFGTLFESGKLQRNKKSKRQINPVNNHTQH